MVWSIRSYQIAIIVLPGPFDILKATHEQVLAYLLDRPAIMAWRTVVTYRIRSPIQNGQAPVGPKHTTCFHRQKRRRVHFVENKGRPDEIYGCIRQVDGRQFALRQADVRRRITGRQIIQQLAADVQGRDMAVRPNNLRHGQRPETRTTAQIEGGLSFPQARQFQQARRIPAFPAFGAK
jgi:hypothetical protein